MQSLIDFLGAYEPLYPQVAKGYPPEAIARLEHALGRPLPAAYRDFLATAAANVGFPLYDLTFDLDEVIELAIEKQPLISELHDVLTPIAVDQSPSYADYYLHLGRPAGEGDGEVVRSGAGSAGFDDIREYPSLRDMLFSWGFRRVRMLPLIHRAWVAWELADFADPKTAPTLAALQRILEQSGFRSLGVTGPTMPLYERGDCAGAVHEVIGGGTFSIYLAADRQPTADMIAETLCDNMPGHGKRRPA
jgi:hypothetical protein